MQKLLTLTLLTLCLTSCGQPIKLNPPPPPPERLVCEKLPVKPDVLPLVAFTAQNGALVYYKADVDARDAKIAAYIVAIRGAWFSCKSNLGWNRDYFAGQ